MVEATKTSVKKPTVSPKGSTFAKKTVAAPAKKAPARTGPPAVKGKKKVDTRLEAEEER